MCLSVICPGKTNDLKEYEFSTNIKALIELLLEGYHIIGDNAYLNSEHLPVPYVNKTTLSLRCKLTSLVT
jgi:hypothetical protein